MNNQNELISILKNNLEEYNDNLKKELIKQEQFIQDKLDKQEKLISERLNEYNDRLLKNEAHINYTYSQFEQKIACQESARSSISECSYSISSKMQETNERLSYQINKLEKEFNQRLDTYQREKEIEREQMEMDKHKIILQLENIELEKQIEREELIYKNRHNTNNLNENCISNDNSNENYINNNYLNENYVNNNDDYIEKIKLLKNHGLSREKLNERTFSFGINCLKPGNKYIIKEHLTKDIFNLMMNKHSYKITLNKIPVFTLINIKDENDKFQLFLNFGFNRQIFENFSLEYIYPDNIFTIEEFDEDNQQILLIIKGYYRIERTNLWNNKERYFNLIKSNYINIENFRNNNEIEFKEFQKEIKNEIKFNLKNTKAFDKDFINEIIEIFFKNHDELLNLYEDKTKKYYNDDKVFKEKFNSLIYYKFDDSDDEYNSMLINDPIIFIKDILINYKELVLEETKDVLPDIYMLCGAVAFPNNYEKKLDKEIENRYKPTCKCFLHFSQNYFEILKQGCIWYYINLLVSLTAQLLAPIYYIYDYKIQNNSFCPNESDYQLKILAVVFFLTLYSQYNDMQDNIVKSQFKYSQTFFIKSRSALILSYIINQIVTFLIPVVTFVLFLEDPTILGFILNCLTAIFLIDLDNMIVIANNGSSLLEMFVHDYMLIQYIKKGVRKNHFIKLYYKNNCVMTFSTLASMCQITMMLSLSLTIGYCL